MRRFIRILLPVSLLLAIFGIWLVKVTDGSAWSPGGGHLLNTSFCALYVAWMLLELPISFREGGQAHSDRGTREVYAVCQAATMLCAMGFAPTSWRPLIVVVAGTSLFVAGVVLRLWAVRTLGRHYSHSVRTLADHRIVDTGPYRLLRHPAYSGMLLAHAGVIVFFCSIPALVVYILGLVPAIVGRIFVEERALLKIDGYAEFAGSRKRIIPLIW